MIEHYHTQQNRALLERIAGATGGNYFALGDVGKLPEAVSFSDAGSVERTVLDLWNMPIIFLVLLLLKAGEWLLRLWGGCERDRGTSLLTPRDSAARPKGASRGRKRRDVRRQPVRRRPREAPSGASRIAMRCDVVLALRSRRWRASRARGAYYLIVGGLGGEAKYQEQFDSRSRSSRPSRAARPAMLASRCSRARARRARRSKRASGR